MQAIFLDKDGTLIDDVPFNVDPARMQLTRHAGAGLRLLRDAGFRFFVISNQAGVAYGKFEEAALLPVQQQLQRLLAQEEVTLSGFYYCPHAPDGSIPGYTAVCDCRKPRPGMLEKAAREHDIDLASSWMIGDILHDVEAGNRAGCHTVLIDNGNETEWHRGPWREPDLVAADLQQAAQHICHLMGKEKRFGCDELG